MSSIQNLLQTPPDPSTWRVALWLVARACHRLEEQPPPSALWPQKLRIHDNDITIEEGELPELRSAPLEILRYIAPEVLRGESNIQGASSCVFSLGAILYELVAGCPAMEGDNAAQVRLSILAKSPRPLIERAPHCHEWLSSLCARMLSRQRELRPTIAEIFALSPQSPPSELVMPRLESAVLPGTLPITAPSVQQEPIAESERLSLFSYHESREPQERSSPLRRIEREQFRWEGEVGRGGLGVVQQATDKSLSRRVAIKQLQQQSPAAQSRFLREIQLTAKLQHPSIVPLYEAGVWPSGEPFYSMKLISGEPLSAMLQRAKTLSERLSFLPNVLAACDAISYAHSQRIIHRDIKPQNILLGDFGETVVIDWGLAKELGTKGPAAPQSPYREDEPSELTQAGAVLGTPAYMPPEQARGEESDERADVYALGAILYHVITGEPPYQSSKKILQEIQRRPPTPPQEKQPDTPKDLIAIVQKAMSREKQERYANAKELAEDLKKFQTGKLVSAHHYSTRERLSRLIKKNKLPLSISLIAFIVLVVLSVIYLRNIIRQEKISSARADELALISARALLEKDPQASLRVLSSLSAGFSQWGAARTIAADALSTQAQALPGVYQRGLSWILWGGGLSGWKAPRLWSARQLYPPLGSLLTFRGSPHRAHQADHRDRVHPNAGRLRLAVHGWCGAALVCPRYRLPAGIQAGAMWYTHAPGSAPGAGQRSGPGRLSGWSLPRVDVSAG